MLTYYYPRTIRSVIMSVIDLFNDIKVYNYIDPISGSTSAATLINVPPIFGPIDRPFATRTEEESGKKSFGGYPAISILLKSITYDKARAQSVNDTRHFYSEEYQLHQLSQYFEDYTPTPVNFNFSIKIRANILDHINQILENVLWTFNSTMVFRVKEFSFLNIERELPIVFGDDIPYTFNEDLEMNQKREVFADLDLTVKGHIYRPIGSEYIIKIINSKYYVNQFDLSGSNSSYNRLAEAYSTSGVEGYIVSAFPSPNRYNLSAFDPLENTYSFTSASSYP